MEQVANIYGNGMPAAQHHTTTEMAISRQAQEVQAAMVIAKKFPRDEVQSFNRIMRACQRKTLAEQAMYEYPRGGTKVTGRLFAWRKPWRRTGATWITALLSWSRRTEKAR